MGGGNSWFAFWFPLALKREGRPENFSERIFLRVYSAFGTQVV